MKFSIGMDNASNSNVDTMVSPESRKPLSVQRMEQAWEVVKDFEEAHEIFASYEKNKINLENPELYKLFLDVAQKYNNVDLLEASVSYGKKMSQSHENNSVEKQISILSEQGMAHTITQGILGSDMYARKTCEGDDIRRKADLVCYAYNPDSNHVQDPCIIDSVISTTALALQEKILDTLESTSYGGYSLSSIHFFADYQARHVGRLFAPRFNLQWTPEDLEMVMKVTEYQNAPGMFDNDKIQLLYIFQIDEQLKMHEARFAQNKDLLSGAALKGKVTTESILLSWRRRIDSLKEQTGYDEMKEFGPNKEYLENHPAFVAITELWSNKLRTLAVSR